MFGLISTTYVMSIIVSNCQHCEEQQFRILSCVHYTDFLSSKVKFIHTSTVTRSHSCYGKIRRTPRVHLVYILAIAKIIVLSFGNFLYGGTKIV